MKISVINLLSPEDLRTEQLVAGALDAYRAEFPEANISVVLVTPENLKDCIGCWSCWVKTPGRCVFSDQMNEVYPAIMASDRVLLMLPVAQGFVSGAAKTFIDRLIPLYHPYIDLHRGEMMHRARYEKYPEFEFFVDASQLTPEEETVLEDYFFRTAYHFKQTGFRLVAQNSHAVANQEGAASIPLMRKALEYREPQPELPAEPQRIQHGSFIVYNGSPRGKSGNSHNIARQIVEGLKHAGVPETAIELRHLVEKSNHPEWAEDYHNHSHHLFVLPLYVHSMPGIVKKYLDQLPMISATAPVKPQLSFFVQSGFSGGYQSYYLRAILARLPKHLNCLYGGTVIRAGMEGLQIQPDEANGKLYAKLQALGKAYVDEGQLQNSTATALESKPFISTGIKVLYYLLKPTGLHNFYWDYRLKQNGAIKRSFDKPYI